LSEQAPTPETIGSIVLQPSGPIVAGSRGAWKLIYTVGPSGIQVGGGLRIFPPHRGMTFWELGKVTAETSRPLATCEVQTFNDAPYSFHHSQPPHIQVTVFGKPLIEGDQVTITIGERGGYSRGYFRRARATDHAYDDYAFEVYVDVLGNGARPLEMVVKQSWVELPDAPAVEVVADRPQRFHVVAKPPGGDDDSFSLVISARDQYTNLASYVGTVKVECTDPEADLPGTIEFTEQDAGKKVVEGCSISADTARITVYDPRQELIGTSNAVAPGFAGEERVYFGDLHVMSGWMGAAMLGNTEYAYRWARDVQGLDFSVVANAGTEPRWQQDLELDDKFNEPGRFATIPALERGWRQGHKNIYYRDSSAPPMPRLSIEEMWEWLGDRQALVIAHHPNCHSETSRYYAWGPQDWSTHNPRFERLAEICQDRGSFELDAVGGNVYLGGLGSSIQDALALGYRLGFVGGTDNHRAQPGSPRSALGGLDPDELPATGGITAVFAPELTREALWDALYQRRCYATTAQRILLDVRLDDHMMGSDLSSEEAAAYSASRTLSVRALGRREIDRIEVVRNNVTVASFVIGSDQTEFEYTDDEPLADIEPASKDAAGVVFYYVRLIQADRNMAWSSPIWLAARG